MSGRRIALVGFVALLMGAAACTPGEGDVVPNEQVAAADRTEDTPSGGGSEAPEGPVVAWAADQIEWDEAPSEAPAGAITVELTCGGLPHNVTFEGVNGDQPVAEAAAGETDVGSATLEAGTVAYYCSVPGHREAGMEGELEVG